eukprot:3695911-Amphidinium_carterae.1
MFSTPTAVCRSGSFCIQRAMLGIVTHSVGHSSHDVIDFILKQMLVNQELQTKSKRAAVAIDRKIRATKVSNILVKTELGGFVKP